MATKNSKAKATVAPDDKPTKKTTAKKSTRTKPAAEKTAKTQAKKSTPTVKSTAKKTTRKPRVVKRKAPAKTVNAKATKPEADFTTTETLEDSLNSTQTTGASAMQETNFRTPSWIGKLIGLLLLLLGIAGLIAAAGYYLDTQAREAVDEYFTENDYRRGEAINRTLEDENVEVETVLTHLDLNRPIYSQVYTNPFDDGQQLVEVNYLRRRGLDYDVTKSYRVVANTGDKDAVTEFARNYDLHTETPESEDVNFVLLQDLDLPEEQRQTEEEIIALLEEKKAEFEELRTAIRAGETEFQDQPIPPDFTVEVVDSYLEQINTELDKLR